MFLFLIVLLPLVLFFCCVKSVLSTKSMMYAFLIGGGLFVGILVSGFFALFTYMHRIPENSFISNFLYFFLHMYFLPCVLVYLVFFICSKDTVQFRISAFFPVTLSFFAVYMPYMIIASHSSAFSFFELFAKPVIVLSMVYLAKRALLCLYEGILEKNKKIAILSSVVLFAIGLIPCVIETLYTITPNLFFVYFLSVLYSFCALVFFVLEVKFSKNVSKNADLYAKETVS